MIFKSLHIFAVSILRRRNGVLRQSPGRPTVTPASFGCEGADPPAHPPLSWVWTWDFVIWFGAMVAKIAGVVDVQWLRRQDLPRWRF